MASFTGGKKNILKFICNLKGRKIAKTMWREKNEAEASHLLISKHITKLLRLTHYGTGMKTDADR